MSIDNHLRLTDSLQRPIFVFSNKVAISGHSARSHIWTERMFSRGLLISIRQAVLNNVPRCLAALIGLSLGTLRSRILCDFVSLSVYLHRLMVPGTGLAPRSISDLFWRVLAPNSINWHGHIIQHSLQIHLLVIKLNFAPHFWIIFKNGIFRDRIKLLRKRSVVEAFLLRWWLHEAKWILVDSVKNSFFLASLVMYADFVRRAALVIRLVIVSVSSRVSQRDDSWLLKWWLLSLLAWCFCRRASTLRATERFIASAILQPDSLVGWSMLGRRRFRPIWKSSWVRLQPAFFVIDFFAIWTDSNRALLCLLRLDWMFSSRSCCGPFADTFTVTRTIRASSCGTILRCLRSVWNDALRFLKRARLVELGLFVRSCARLGSMQ